MKQGGRRLYTLPPSLIQSVVSISLFESLPLLGLDYHRRDGFKVDAKYYLFVGLYTSADDRGPV